jgi:hypothetical protein
MFPLWLLCHVKWCPVQLILPFTYRVYFEPDPFTYHCILYPVQCLSWCPVQLILSPTVVSIELILSLTMASCAADSLTYRGVLFH